MRAGDPKTGKPGKPILRLRLFGALLLAAALAAWVTVHGTAIGGAVDTDALIKETAAGQDVELSRPEVDMLYFALPIIGRRYLRPVETTPLLEHTFKALKELDETPAAEPTNGAPPARKTRLGRIGSALNAGLRTLDAHTAYLDPEGYGELKIRISGKFAGLGLEVTMEDGLIKVVAPIDDTPAQRAGMLAGDKISHVDGTPVKGMTLREAVGRMRGEVDTTIRLTVLRPERPDSFELTIVRDIIRIPAVRHRVEDDYGYIRISAFSERTETGLRKALRRIEKELGDDAKGLVIDLRNNPGGLLRQAVRVADTFLDDGTIVSVRGRLDADNDEYFAKDGALATERPLVVLVNSGTASAAEIVAGALKENGRATLVGSRSFGKGSVQTILPVGPNAEFGALRLTTALYYTPSGQTIQAWGVVPNLLIETDGQEPARREEELNNALTRGEATPNRSGPLATITGQRCNDLLEKTLEDEALACAVALLRLGGLERLADAGDDTRHQ
ncbi:MAG: S41 family peptidase [Alphaproteobacteria bacterium]|mgnify:CR=1 FL=1|jgi:carboxyl-terminal processing protease|nr:S41 family peptidase [Alphaproteobacteria bacterium]MDP6567114.1 S41 family peptidase [Alphaproteobacteria bacterium]MDP6813138.1 S41 family peptidase [Alphaproteobacteria bacterium]